MNTPPGTYNLVVPIVYSETLSMSSAMHKNARWATHTTHYPPQGRGSLACSMGLRLGTQAGAIANFKGHSRSELNVMLDFADLKRDIRGTSGTHSPPRAQWFAQRGCWDALGLCIPLRNCGLGGFAQARNKTGRFWAGGALVDSLIGHLERDSRFCPRLRLIEASS